MTETLPQSTTDTAIVDDVRARYGDAARAILDGSTTPADDTPGCGGPSEGFGVLLYDDAERASLPDAAVLASLGCGNPTAVAELREG